MVMEISTFVLKVGFNTHAHVFVCLNNLTSLQSMTNFIYNISLKRNRPDSLLTLAVKAYLMRVIVMRILCFAYKCLADKNSQMPIIKYKCYLPTPFSGQTTLLFQLQSLS